VFVLLKLLGNKRLFILLFALIIFIAVMGLTSGNRENMTWPEKMLQDTVKWTQSLFYKPASFAAGLFEDIKHMRLLYEENQALRQTLAHYARDSARLSMLESENIRLKEALKFTEQQMQLDEYKYHIAEVISESADPFNQTININIGSKDGIKEDMVVVSTKGLIGRVTRVSPFYSSVQLITNLDVRVSSTKAVTTTVQGKENVSFGIIESYDRENNYLIMNKIPQDDPMVIGDTVVTSSLGPVFPEGIVIGTVVSREEGDFGLTHTALIKPAASFHHLREVFVVETTMLEE
jgi:rod shape-determining protein MreC